MILCPECKIVEVNKEGKLCNACWELFILEVEAKMRIIVPKYLERKYESPEWRKKELGEL